MEVKINSIKKDENEHLLVELVILDGENVVDSDTANFAGTTTNDEILTYAENYLKAVESNRTTPVVEVVKPVNETYTDLAEVKFAVGGKEAVASVLKLIGVKEEPVEEPKEEPVEEPLEESLVVPEA